MNRERDGINNKGGRTFGKRREVDREMEMQRQAEERPRGSH